MGSTARRVVDPLCEKYRPSNPSVRKQRYIGPDGKPAIREIKGMVWGECSDKCPVKMKTGQDACAGTPAEQYFDKQIQYTNDRSNKRLSRPMVIWLTELRDELVGNQSS